MVNHKDSLAIDLRKLIAAAGEVAFEYAESDEDARRLAQIALIEFLKNRPYPVDFNGDFQDPAADIKALH